MAIKDNNIHFGIKFRKDKSKLVLNREDFAIINTHPSLPKFDSLDKIGAYTESEKLEYSLKWCEEYREVCLQNFDANMLYFNNLNIDEFKKTFNLFLKKNPQFTEITDLNECKDMPGYYIMVLDVYKQIYIGKSQNIKKRIQQHWSKVMPFDRILFPMYNAKSILSINSFCAYDTTRIFVWKRTLSDGIERKLIENFPEKFSCNRIGGDVTTATDAMITKRSQNR